MKMKSCIIALLGLLPTPALGQQGQWEEWFPFGDLTVGLGPLVAVHLIHVYDGSTGKVIVITYLSNDSSEPYQWCDPACVPECVGQLYLWTPALNSPGNPGTFESIPLCRTVAPGTLTQLFCGGHTALADGRILVVGGEQPPNYGIELTNLFNPLTSSWNPGSPPRNMEFERWYPTATTLADGRVLGSV